MPAPSRFPSYGIHFQISKSQLDGLLGSPAPEQRPDAGQELREREGFHKVIVGTFIEPFDSVLDCIASGEDENWSLQSAFSQSGQHLKPVTARKHEIQKDKVEFLCVNQEESLFSAWRNDNFVLFALQSFSESASHLCFIFDN